MMMPLVLQAGREKVMIKGCHRNMTATSIWRRLASDAYTLMTTPVAQKVIHLAQVLGKRDVPLPHLERMARHFIQSEARVIYIGGANLHHELHLLLVFTRPLGLCHRQLLPRGTIRMHPASLSLLAALPV